MNSGRLTKALGMFSECMRSSAKLVKKENLLTMQALTANRLSVDSKSCWAHKSKPLTNRWVNPTFFKNIQSFKPLFHFYVYKVDKQIYKNSRGKSGKYTFLWKYITPYKRFNFVASKLSKEIKFDGSASAQRKVNNIISKYVHSKNLTFTSKSIRFSNNYVFFNSRNTLLQNYRTVKSR